MATSDYHFNLRGPNKKVRAVHVYLLSRRFHYCSAAGSPSLSLRPLRLFSSPISSRASTAYLVRSAPRPPLKPRGCAIDGCAAARQLLASLKHCLSCWGSSWIPNTFLRSCPVRCLRTSGHLRTNQSVTKKFNRGFKPRRPPEGGD